MTSSARLAARWAALAMFAGLAFWNLDAWPRLWFDEGVHLHVPKALVLFGVYADYSSEGFRHYGPTMSVGPTVMLPIAAAFHLFGIDLFVARTVSVLYLVAAVACYFVFAARLGGERLAWVATALLVSSVGVDVLYLGRQVLGEVPAFAFVMGGLICWHAAWERPAVGRLVAAGVLFGLAVVTKYQFLLLLAPGLVGAWLVNRVWHRVLPDRVFLWPLVIAMAVFGTWMATAVLALGPSTVAENLALMRRATRGAALGFSTDNVGRAASTLFSFSLYGALLLPAVIHAAVRGLDRSMREFRWTALLCLIVPALGWFLLASIGWRRYAFAAVALAGLLVARLLADLTGGFRWPLPAGGGEARRRAAVAAAAWALLVSVVSLPLAQRSASIVRPPESFWRAAAAYLEAHVPHDALVETWEPELGFLTNHRYHYPPSALLIDAVAHRFGGGPSPGDVYDFTSNGLPDYVINGEFGTWVGVYPEVRLREAYDLLVAIGPYAIYQRRPSGDNGRSPPR
jgi:4-amino-4-deoxy-L-arabinose transferase-like glycosyltransferase